MKGIIIIILIFTSNLWSQEFSMDLSGSMEEGIIGAPIYIRIELKNTSGREQKVSGLIKYEYNLKKKNGEVIKRRPESIIEHLYEPCDKTKINYLSKDWKDIKIINLIELYKIEEEGGYILEIKAGPRCKIGINKEGKTDENVWYGKIKQEVKIDIEEPEGQDREAYEYFKNSKYKGVPLVGEGSKEVLDKFPTSTYAGWVVWRSMYNPSEGEIEYFYYKFKYKHSNSVPTKDGWQPLSFDDYLNWQKEWAERILENHPEFPMANKLKLLLSVINLWNGNEKVSNFWFNKIPKESKEYKWGKEFFEYLKEKSKERETKNEKGIK